MKVLNYLFGPAFRHIFAIIITLLIFSMLAWSDLTETGKTRMEDLAAMVVGYYYLASISGTKKDEIVGKMVENQTQLVNAGIVSEVTVEEDVIRSGDPVTVTKE